MTRKKFIGPLTKEAMALKKEQNRIKAVKGKAKQAMRQFEKKSKRMGVGVKQYQPQQSNNVSSRPVRDVVERYLPGFGDLAQAVGSGAQSFLSKIFGSGDYKIISNSVKSNTIPQFVTSNNNSCRMCDTEKIMDIIVTTDLFKILLDNQPINPTNKLLFPNLSKWFEKKWTGFKFHGLVFYLKSFGANSIVSSTPSVGGLLMASKYNVNDGSFNSETEMENVIFKTVIKSYEHGEHAIECKSDETMNEGRLFVNNSSTGGSNDLRLTALANVTIACIGNPVAGLTHKLFVTYDVEGFNSQPQLPNIPNQALTLAPADIAAGNLFSANTTTSYNSQFIGSPLITTSGSLALKFAPQCSGNFKIDIQLSGAGAAANSNPPSVASTSSNILALNVYAGGTNISGDVTNIRVQQKQVSSYAFTMKPDGNTGTITFLAFTPSTAPFTGTLYISPLPVDITVV